MRRAAAPRIAQTQGRLLAVIIARTRQLPCLSGMQAVLGRLHPDSWAAVAIKGSDLILTEVRIIFDAMNYAMPPGEQPLRRIGEPSPFNAEGFIRTD